MIRITRIQVDADVRSDVASICSLFPGPREIQREWFKAIFRELCRELRRTKGRVALLYPLGGDVFVWEYLPKTLWVTYRAIEKRFPLLRITTITILAFSPFDPIPEGTRPD